MEITKEELQTLQNHEFLKTKFHLSKSITEELQKIGNEMVSEIKSLEPSHIFNSFVKPSPKVSRGENYQSLPYFMLDYPRHFKETETIAVRNMILWGQFISCTLQLSGGFKKKFEEIISQKLLNFSQLDQWYICVNTTPWEHHFLRDNFLPINELNMESLNKIFRNMNFIKLTTRHDISEITNLSEIVLNDFKEFISLLK